VLAVGLLAFLIGLAVGLTLFRIKIRWCPHCGNTTQPVQITSGGPPAMPNRGRWSDQ
jgi:hypothetical protein